ncbi:hypothetical protein M8494_24695 [Serratia ureilytica]
MHGVTDAAELMAASAFRRRGDHAVLLRGGAGGRGGVLHQPPPNTGVMCPTERLAPAVVAMICFMVGRFFSTWLMGRVKPATLLAAYALINIALCGVVMLSVDGVSVVALIIDVLLYVDHVPDHFRLGGEKHG